LQQTNFKNMKDLLHVEHNVVSFCYNDYSMLYILTNHFLIENVDNDKPYFSLLLIDSYSM